MQTTINNYDNNNYHNPGSQSIVHHDTNNLSLSKVSTRNPTPAGSGAVTPQGVPIGCEAPSGIDPGLIRRKLFNKVWFILSLFFPFSFVGPSVYRSVRLLVRPSVRPSLGSSVALKVWD